MEHTNGYQNGKSESGQEETLLSPFNYICQVSGKRIREKLAKVRFCEFLAFNFWLQISDENLEKISEIVQMLHNASLMIDDIEDNSILRRGLPVTHSIYGTPQTINSANYVYFLALEKAMKLGHPKAVQIYTEQMLELHRGQGMELYWRDTVTCPTQKQYLDMVARKTGGLFGLAVGLMQLFSQNKECYTPLIRTLGLHFQIRDDFANLVSKDYADKKTFAEDLTEGKFSYPIIHAIENSTHDTQILNILRQKPTEFEVKKYCVELLEKLGSFEYTKRTLVDLEKEAVDQIDAFGGNPLMMCVIDEMKDVYSS